MHIGKIICDDETLIYFWTQEIQKVSDLQNLRITVEDDPSPLGFQIKIASPTWRSPSMLRDRIQALSQHGIKAEEKNSFLVILPTDENFKLMRERILKYEANSFHMAAIQGNLMKLQFFLEQDAKIAGAANRSLYRSLPCKQLMRQLNPLELAAVNGHIDASLRLAQAKGLIEKDLFLKNVPPLIQANALRKAGATYKTRGVPPAPARFLSLTQAIRDTIYSKEEELLKLVRAYIEYDPNSVHEGKDEHERPITCAIKNGYKEIVALLLENEAELPKDALSLIASAIRVRSGDFSVSSPWFEIFQFLLAKGENQDSGVNAKALGSVLENRYHAVIKDLLKLTIAWDYIDEKGNTLVHLALRQFPEIIRDLCQAGANPNQLDRRGYTLMHRLASGELGYSDAKCIELLAVLRDLNADPTIRLPDALDSLTPLQMAYKTNNQNLAQVLERHTAQFKPLKVEDTVEAQKEQMRCLLERERRSRAPVSQMEKEILQQLAEAKEKQTSLQKEYKRLQRERDRLGRLLEQEQKNSLVPPKVTVKDYKAQDLYEAKGMVFFYVDALSRFPAQTPALLRHVAIAKKLSRESIEKILFEIMVGQKFSMQDGENLLEDLVSINEIANWTPQQLCLKSEVRYAPEDIAKIVFDAAMEMTLANQKPSEVVAMEIDSPPLQAAAGTVIFGLRAQEQKFPQANPTPGPEGSI